MASIVYFLRLRGSANLCLLLSFIMMPDVACSVLEDEVYLVNEHIYAVCSVLPLEQSAGSPSLSEQETSATPRREQVETVHAAERKQLQVVDASSLSDQGIVFTMLSKVHDHARRPTHLLRCRKRMARNNPTALHIHVSSPADAADTLRDVWLLTGRHSTSLQAFEGDSGTTIKEGILAKRV